LLALAAQLHQVFITVDRNLYFQQNVPKFKIAVVILVARSNRLADLKPLVDVLSELMALNPGEVVFIPRQPK